MGIWIEMRCEDRGEPWSEGRQDHRCWSHDNAGPMEMANDTRASVATTLAGVEDQARRAGWRKMRHGWVCPYCVAGRREAQGGDRGDL